MEVFCVTLSKKTSNERNSILTNLIYGLWVLIFYSQLLYIVETQFDYFAQDDFRVRNPDIKISIDGKPVSHEEITEHVKASFKI